LQGRRDSGHPAIRSSRVAGHPGRADDGRPGPQDLHRCARRFEEEGGGGSLVSAGVSTRPSSLRGRHAIVSSAMKAGPFLIALVLLAGCVPDGSPLPTATAELYGASIELPRGSYGWNR